MGEDLVKTKALIRSLLRGRWLLAWNHTAARLVRHENMSEDERPGWLLSPPCWTTAISEDIAPRLESTSKEITILLAQYAARSYHCCFAKRNSFERSSAVRVLSTLQYSTFSLASVTCEKQRKEGRPKDSDECDFMRTHKEKQDCGLMVLVSKETYDYFWCHAATSGCRHILLMFLWISYFYYWQHIPSPSMQVLLIQ